MGARENPRWCQQLGRRRRGGGVRGGGPAGHWGAAGLEEDPGGGVEGEARRAVAFEEEIAPGTGGDAGCRRGPGREEHARRRSRRMWHGGNSSCSRARGSWDV